MKVKQPAGVILAGGRSRRMGVSRKALLEINGRSLLAHATEQLQPHLKPLLLSCESETNDFDDFNLEVVPDLLPGFRGPLTGLYSALQYLTDRGIDNGLVLCPCDAPFIPSSLVGTLLGESQDEPGPVVVISYHGVLQPTFSLWQNHHLPVVRAAMLDKGIGGLKRVLRSLPHKIIEWEPTEPNPFFNVNTPEDLKTAALWLDRMQA
ncbi:MAG: molybdenum cofactor guanylyltransferase [Xanthomonadales bacterium]|nr:molybdenum cofactor guanylyltransferase [Xanthomonadales bacterium]